MASGTEHYTAILCKAYFISVLHYYKQTALYSLTKI